MAQPPRRKRPILWGGLGRYAPASTPPLDLIAGSVGAYGFRLLRSAYAGKAMQVTRASDSAVQDIGFAGNDFDTAGYTAFIGASSGTVTRWYDQSGNGNDLTVAASAPTVNLSGLNGKPTAAFVTTTNLHHATPPTLVMPLTVNAVAQRTSFGGGYSGIIGDDSSNYALYFDTALNGVTIYNGGSIATPVAATDNVAHSLAAVFNGASSSITVDGATSAAVTGSNSFVGLRLGIQNGGLAGFISEATYWNGQMSAANITALAANQKSYWNTP